MVALIISGWVFGLPGPGQNPALGQVMPLYMCPSEPHVRIIEGVVSNGQKLVMATTSYQGVSGRNYTAPGWKKAIVQIREGETIEIFQGAQV